MMRRTLVLLLVVVGGASPSSAFSAPPLTSTRTETPASCDSFGTLRTPGSRSRLSTVRRILPTPRPSTRLSSSSTGFVPDLLDFYGPLSTAVIVVFALGIGFAAQSFINSMLEGDQGLGAFLSDGGGYSKSGFKPRKQGSEEGNDAPLGGQDPLPWLKLPRLDFVEVAGQEEDVVKAPIMRQIHIEGMPSGGPIMSPEEEARIVAKLEDMAQTLRAELRASNVKEAEAIRLQLETTMAEYGIEYEEGFQ